MRMASSRAASASMLCSRAQFFSCSKSSWGNSTFLFMRGMLRGWVGQGQSYAVMGFLYFDLGE